MFSYEPNLKIEIGGKCEHCKQCWQKSNELDRYVDIDLSYTTSYTVKQIGIESDSVWNVLSYFDN